MAGLSLDLREQIVGAYEEGEGTVRELAARFGVSPRSVSRYLKLKRETGSLAPRIPSRNGPAPKLDPEMFCRLWHEHPNASRSELARLLKERAGVAVHRSTISRTAKRLGLVDEAREVPPEQASSHGARARA